MLASIKNDNEDCIGQGACPVYPPIFKVLLGCLSAMKNPLRLFKPDTVFKKADIQDAPSDRYNLHYHC